jgi:hypothetical protein
MVNLECRCLVRVKQGKQRCFDLQLPRVSSFSGSSGATFSDLDEDDRLAITFSKQERWETRRW